MTTKHPTNGARVFNPSFLPLRQGRVKNPCSVLCAFILGATLCHAQNHTLYYGANSNALDVAFADTTLSVSNQTLIVADLNQCLQSDWGKQVEFWTGNDDPAFVANLSYPRRNLFYEPFPRDIVATPNGHALHISKEVSDSYNTLFGFFADNTNIVTTGYAFVEFLSSTNFPNIQATDWPNYYLARYKTDAEVIALAPRHIPAIANYTFFPPSILNFNYVEYTTTMPGTNYFVMAIPISSSRSYFSKIPAIYHDERWKLMDMQWFIDPNRPQYEVDDEDE